MLNNFRIITRNTNATKTLLGGQQLTKRRTDDIVHQLETILTRLSGKPFGNMRQLEHEYVDMIVLYRHIAPATALEP